MSMLFIRYWWFKRSNRRKLGLKPPKNDSKDNNMKKESIEDRIIKKCEMAQKDCSLLLDQIPRWDQWKVQYNVQLGKIL